MPSDWNAHLERWIAEGFVDSEAAERIRQWESRRTPTHRFRWPVWLAIAFGAILLCAGILLFVAAHWDELSPGQRMLLVVLLVAVFHVGGAWTAERFRVLSVALHAVGTASLGAGIALVGQIFHLSEHWPIAILLWAMGALAAWGLLGHWPQATIAAILLPWWVCSEWIFFRPSYTPVFAGLCALAFTYLGARRGAPEGSVRTALSWLGAIGILPAAIAVGIEPRAFSASGGSMIVWAVAVMGPLAIAFAFRGLAAIWNAGFSVWTLILVVIVTAGTQEALMYFWYLVGALGVVAWGIRESRIERINLGVLGFGLTVLAFYFSYAFDKLGRSVVLIGLGLLFLFGGWLLERTRRRLIGLVRTQGVLL